MSFVLKKIKSAIPDLFFWSALPRERKEHYGEDSFSASEGLFASLKDRNQDELRLLLLTHGVVGGLFRLLKREALLALAWNLLRLVCGLSAPFLLHELLLLLGGDTKSGASLFTPLLLAVGFAAVSLVASLSMQHFFNIGLIAYQKSVVILGQSVYATTLLLPLRERKKRRGGDMVNHMSSDSEAVADIFILVGDFFYSIACIVFGFALLFFYLEEAALMGLAFFIALVPLGRWVGRRFWKHEELVMAEKDQRIEALSQVLSAIKVIKCFGWEKASVSKVGAIRKKELRHRKFIVALEALARFLFVGTSYLAAAATFLAYVLWVGELNVAQVFASLAVFKLIEEPFGQLTVDLSGLMNVRVSAKRIAEFLAAGSSPAMVLGSPSSSSSEMLALQGATAPADDRSGFRLDNVHFSVSRGEAVAVVGSVGSGKTSLLLALLGELELGAGTLFRNVVGLRGLYVPQEAFIQNASVSSNITFGGDLEAVDLVSVVADAGLSLDVERIPGGLAGEIGENGVNLSGGQRQRVNLARVAAAADSESDIVMLDDPFSALDPRVEGDLVDQLLFGRWKNKSRVVATHRLAHLRRFDRIVHMESGRVVGEGSYEELLQSCTEFRSFVEAHQENSGTQLAHEDDLVEVKTGEKAQKTTVADASFVAEEDRERGVVKWSHYLALLRTLIGTGRLRWLLGGLLFVSVLAAVALPLGQSLLLSRIDFAADGHGLKDLSIYAFLGLVAVVASVFQSFLWRSRSLESASQMHDQALSRVVRAPARFFDLNPSGRIVNRFSADLSALETQLAWATDALARNSISVLASLALLLFYFPALALLVLPSILLFRRVQSRYRVVARDAKRLESVSRSPRFSQFKETVAGLEVVRSFGRQNAFRSEFEKRLFRHMKMFRASTLANRWLSVRVSLLSSALSFAVAAAVVVASTQGQMALGAVGLLLTCSIGFWESLNWAVRSFSEIESRMTAFERLQSYAHIETEASTREHPFGKGGESAKNELLLSFRSVSLRYAEHLPEIVREFSLSIRPGEKVGVVGRTGSGKSSLFQALFRFIHPHEGQILFRGVDTRSMELEALRSQFALVSQDSCLLPTTIRENLDPTGRQSDAALWQVLEKVRLAKTVRRLSGGLDHELKEGAANLSLGQRQLLCLARAIEKRAPVLLLDEATASVDVLSDQIIQEVIRNELPEVAVIAIAHRVETLVGYDTICELENGQLKSLRRRSKSLDFAPPQNIVPELSPVVWETQENGKPQGKWEPQAASTLGSGPGTA